MLASGWQRLGEDGKVEQVLWFARGVGMVKKTVAATATTHELLAYSIPK